MPKKGPPGMWQMLTKAERKAFVSITLFAIFPHCDTVHLALSAETLLCPLHSPSIAGMAGSEELRPQWFQIPAHLVIFTHIKKEIQMSLQLKNLVAPRCREGLQDARQNPDPRHQPTTLTHLLFDVINIYKQVS